MTDAEAREAAKLGMLSKYWTPGTGWEQRCADACVDAYLAKIATQAEIRSAIALLDHWSSKLGAQGYSGGSAALEKVADLIERLAPKEKGAAGFPAAPASEQS